MKNVKAWFIWLIIWKGNLVKFSGGRGGGRGGGGFGGGRGGGFGGGGGRRDGGGRGGGFGGGGRGGEYFNITNMSNYRDETCSRFHVKFRRWIWWGSRFISIYL